MKEPWYAFALIEIETLSVSLFRVAERALLPPLGNAISLDIHMLQEVTGGEDFRVFSNQSGGGKIPYCQGRPITQARVGQHAIACSDTAAVACITLGGMQLRAHNISTTSEA